MKKFLLPLALLALLPVPLLADPGWKEIVTKFKADAIEQKKAEEKKNTASPAPGGMVFPDTMQILDGMFLRYPVTHISADGVDIYISDTEIYVISPPGSDPTNENWNLAVTADGVFEWQTGKKKGIKIKRKNEDIIGYLFYILDPSGLNTALYGRYLAQPGLFNVLPGKGGDWKEFQLKKPADGFEAVYVIEKPLWYHGFRMKSTDGSVHEAINSAPGEIKKIPDAVKAKLKGIEFEDSPLTLERHMVFL